MFRLAQRQRAAAVHVLWRRHIYNNYSTSAPGSLSSTIRLSSIPAPHSGDITILSLNRPKARNAISTQLLGELSHVVEQLHAEGDRSSTRALIVASESDDAFCAGADLKERLSFTDDEYAHP